MKTKKYTFKWYKKRDRRKADRLSIGSNGVLHLGRVLREKLPERIQIGFDQDQRMLAVMEGGEEGFPWPRSGGITSTEDRIMQEQFRTQLSQEGQDLLLMLESGCSLEQIENRLHMDEPDIYLLGAELGKKWREFSNEI